LRPFAASDGESRLKHRGDKKFGSWSGTIGKGDMDGEITGLDIDRVLVKGGV
jgi:hypothetical protein